MLNIGGSASGQANALSSAVMCRPPTDLPLLLTFVQQGPLKRLQGDNIGMVVTQLKKEIRTTKTQ